MYVPSLPLSRLGTVMCIFTFYIIYIGFPSILCIQAFYGWAEYTINANEKKWKLEIAMKRWAEGALCAAFCTWKTYTLKTTKAKQVSQRHFRYKLNVSEGQTSIVDPLKIFPLQVLFYFARRALHAAFLAWHQFWVDVQVEAVKLHKAARQWFNAVLRKALNSWHEFIELKRWKAHQLQCATAKWRMLSLQCAFTAWKVIFVAHVLQLWIMLLKLHRKLTMMRFWQLDRWENKLFLARWVHPCREW